MVPPKKAAQSAKQESSSDSSDESSSDDEPAKKSAPASKKPAAKTEESDSSSSDEDEVSICFHDIFIIILSLHLPNMSCYIVLKFSFLSHCMLNFKLTLLARYFCCFISLDGPLADAI